jgi:GNAT superfamily N-acetyltransferase
MNKKLNLNSMDFRIRKADKADTIIIVEFIRELAEYEKLLDQVKVTEKNLKENLFGERPFAEAIIGELNAKPIAFALFFHNYSTFLGKPGLYLEDLYVQPKFRGQGYGKIILSYLAKLAINRNCGRFEWSVLDWNEPAIQFYQKIGAKPMSEWTVQRLDGKALEKLAKEFG